MLDLESSLWCSLEPLLEALFVNPMRMQCWNNFFIDSFTWSAKGLMIHISVHAFYENSSKLTIKSSQEIKDIKLHMIM